MSLLSKVKINWKRLLRWSFYLQVSSLLCILGIFEVGVFFNPFSCELIEDLPHAKVISDRHGEIFWASVSDDDNWQLPVPLAKMSPHVKNAIIAAEDARFYKHNGVDPVSVIRAAVKSLLAGRLTSGASTLTMQVVKMAHLRRKSVKYKFVQMCEALSLERQRSKEWILERYLNMAPYGGNIVGIEAASRHYFRKKASDLNVYESSLLAGLPQAPSRLRPDRYPGRAQLRQAYVLEQMKDHGFIDGYPKLLSYKRQIPQGSINRLGFPQYNKEIAEMVEGNVDQQTTLDLDLQFKMRRLVNDHLSLFEDIQNASLIVIDNKTSEVQSLICCASVEIRQYPIFC